MNKQDVFHTKKQEILLNVEKVIQEGPYSDDWQSLCAYKPPRWYEEAKFGIFIHWGVYSVPAFGNEWYPRSMYIKDSPEYKHHIKTYGEHKNFGYKDFIPMFKAELFDADEWMEIFRDSGAKYVMPVAEHHDGFQMYDSELSDWNAKKMGPGRDIVGELKQAADKNGIVYALSNHRAEHCWFFNGGLEFESDVDDPANEDFYWKQQGEVRMETTHDIYSPPPSKEQCEDWLARVCEMIDKYRPKIVWFDWWIHNIGYKPYLKKFTAYYYNRAVQWGEEVAINYKYNAFPPCTAVFDVERGQLNNIRPRLWQTDTATARNSWGYTENNDFKDPADLIRDLIDIVSKNGCFLLSIGPKPDGTICDEDKEILKSIGTWLRQTGEGIYGSTHWDKFGEGPTNIKDGSFTDSKALVYTTEDFRFTYKNSFIYAFAMNYPENGAVKIKSLKHTAHGHVGSFDIKSITILGYDLPLDFQRDEAELSIMVKGTIKTDYPVCFKIEID